MQPFCTAARPHTGKPALQRALHQVDHGPVCKWAVAVIQFTAQEHVLKWRGGCALLSRAETQDCTHQAAEYVGPQCASSTWDSLKQAPGMAGHSSPRRRCCRARFPPGKHCAGGPLLVCTRQTDFPSAACSTGMRRLPPWSRAARMSSLPPTATACEPW